MRENGAHLRAQSVTHNTVWPPHTPNRKYLNVCWRDRKREREPSSLRTLVCGRKEKENISGCVYHISAQCLLPVSSSPPFCHFCFLLLKVRVFHGWCGGCEALLWFLGNLSFVRSLYFYFMFKGCSFPVTHFGSYTREGPEVPHPHNKSMSLCLCVCVHV